MAERKYYKCLVCGRPFPRGQGIIIEKAGFKLTFHSSKCAAKFLKLLMERIDSDCIRPALRELVKELEESLKIKQEKTKKVI